MSGKVYMEIRFLFIRRAFAYLCDIIITFGALFVLPQTLISTLLWPLLGISRESFRNGFLTEAYVIGLISAPVWLHDHCFHGAGTGVRVRWLQAQG